MAMKHKVALIHNIVAPYRIPLFQGLAKHPALDVCVYFCAKTHEERKWNILESDQYDHTILQGVTFELPGIIYHINPSIVLRLLKGKYDAVILGGISDFTTQVAFFITKIINVPVILWSEETGIKQSLLRRIANTFKKHIVRNVDTIIVPGTMSRNFHTEMTSAPERVFVAPNIVENELFIKKSSELRKEKEKLKQELGIGNQKMILFVGQLIERKGVEYLIRAYRRLKREHSDICLVILGDGALKSDLENVCANNGIKDVRFTGWVSEEAKIVYYSVADIFVLPTLEDVWGMVVNEAMACGLPLVSTKSSGSAVDMIMPGENGLIVDAEDVEQLYSAMKTIISNEELAKKMGSKSLEVARNRYNLGNMVEGFVSAIEHAIKMKG